MSVFLIHLINEHLILTYCSDLIICIIIDILFLIFSCNLHVSLPHVVQTALGPTCPLIELIEAGSELIIYLRLILNLRMHP